MYDAVCLASGGLDSPCVLATCSDLLVSPRCLCSLIMGSVGRQLRVSLSGGKLLSARLSRAGDHGCGWLRRCHKDRTHRS